MSKMSIIFVIRFVILFDIGRYRYHGNSIIRFLFQYRGEVSSNLLLYVGEAELDIGLVFRQALDSLLIMSFNNWMIRRTFCQIELKYGPLVLNRTNYSYPIPCASSKRSIVACLFSILNPGGYFLWKKSKFFCCFTIFQIHWINNNGKLKRNMGGGNHEQYYTFQKFCASKKLFLATLQRLLPCSLL